MLKLVNFAFKCNKSGGKEFPGRKLHQMSGVPDVTLTIVKFFSLFPTEPWMFPQMSSKNVRYRAARKLFYPDQSMIDWQICIHHFSSLLLRKLSICLSFPALMMTIFIQLGVSSRANACMMKFHTNSNSRLLFPRPLTQCDDFHEQIWNRLGFVSFTGQCLVKNYWFWTMM